MANFMKSSIKGLVKMFEISAYSCDFSFSRGNKLTGLKPIPKSMYEIFDDTMADLITARRFLYN